MKEDNERVDALNAILIALSVAFMIKGDTPSAHTGKSTEAFGLKYFVFIFSFVCFPVRKRMTHTAEIACEITVASAAPCTPMPNTKIKTGSKMILQTAPIRTVFIPTLENPCVLIKEFNPIVSMTNKVPFP